LREALAWKASSEDIYGVQLVATKRMDVLFVQMHARKSMPKGSASVSIVVVRPTNLEPGSYKP